MIKRKGVCDVCTREFELDKTSFAIGITEEILDHRVTKWTVTILGSVEEAPGEGFSHVCGKTCLYRAIDEFITKKTEPCRFKVIVDNTDGGAIEGHGGANSK